MSRHVSVGIAEGYRLGGCSSIPGKGKRRVPSPQRPDRFWGSFNLLSNGYRGYFHGVKRPGRDVVHSPPSTAEVKNGVAIPPLPLTSSWQSTGALAFTCLGIRSRADLPIQSVRMWHMRVCNDYIILPLTGKIVPRRDEDMSEGEDVRLTSSGL
jgi:hypothetical protein